MKIENIDRLQQKFMNILKNIDEPVKKSVEIAGRNIRDTAKVDMEFGVKTGKLRGKALNPSQPHRASAPGESPAVDTGVLIRSVVSEISSGGLSVRVGTNVDYGMKLELGIGIAARTWLLPAFENNKQKIKDDFDQRIINFLRKEASARI